MKIITVEEHFMSDRVNDRFKELNPPKDPVEENQVKFVDLYEPARIDESIPRW